MTLRDYNRPTPELVAFAEAHGLATANQLACLRAWIEHGTGQKAAIAMGLSGHTTFSRMFKAVLARAEARGFGANRVQAGDVQPGFRVKGTSTLYDKAGVPALQWVKTREDKAAQDALFRAFLADLVKDVEGRSLKVESPAIVAKDLMTVIPMGDPHCGMLAWSKETGEDFGLPEFERRLTGAVDMLVSSGPATPHCLFINLGDFFHADDQRNRTPGSGHDLDVDGRYAKVALIAYRSMVRAIDALKAKHRRVTVWNKPGNHDPHSYLMLAMALNAYYSNDERVDVPIDPCHFSYMRFGKNLFGSTHGHGPKLHELPMIMASDRKQDWGETSHRVWFVGHYHHKKVIEDLTGCTVEIARTLAGSDAWHHASGYRSMKSMQSIVYHREFGEITRSTCGIDRIAGASNPTQQEPPFAVVRQI